MEYITNNHEKFPQNVLEPYVVIINNRHYTVYPFQFKGLYDLYNYLKSDPEINKYVFKGHLASIGNSYSFAGKSYNEAVDDLIGDIDPGYEEFLRIEKKLNSGKGLVHKYEQIKSVAGGHVNVPLYTAGSPLIYEASRIVSKPKFININITLSYYYGTSKSQVFNRAVIITNIIKALEREGYTVNVNAFELNDEGNELFKMLFDIKNYGGKISYPALYKSLCNVEFLRRICFRILETSDVKNSWKFGYGHTCDRDFARKVLKLNKGDLFFSEPREIGIYGDDIGKDFDAAIKYLKLGNIIDTEKEKRVLKERVRSLKNSK